MIQLVKLSDITKSSGYQYRALSEEQVERLRNRFERRKGVDPIILNREGERLMLVSGYHRVEAAHRAGVRKIPAEVLEVSRFEALLRAGEENMHEDPNVWPVEVDGRQRLDAMLVEADPPRRGSGPGGWTGWTLSRAAGLLGVSVESIRRWRSPSRRERHNVLRRESRRDDRRVAQMARTALESEAEDAFGARYLTLTYEPRVDWAQREGSPGTPGVPVLFLSDLHIGEVVRPEEVRGSNGFNLAIARARLRQTAEVAVTLLRSHMAHPHYEGLLLLLGGDIISGGLHDELVQTDVPETPLGQSRVAAELLSDLVAFLVREMGRVSVYGVPGNHGRVSRRPRAKLYAQDNLDYHTYLMLERDHRATEGVDFNFPASRDLTIEVAGHRLLLTHGDQFRGGDGMIGPIGPVVRGDIRKRILGEALGDSHDLLLCGHFHQMIATRRVMVNGSLKGYDEYALGIGAPWEPPQQLLFTLHPRLGVNWIMPIQAGDQKDLWPREERE